MKKLFIIIILLLTIILYSDLPDIDINFDSNLFSDDFNEYFEDMNKEWNEHLKYIDKQWEKLYEESQKEWDKYYEEYTKKEVEFIKNFKAIWGEDFEYVPDKWYDFSNDLKSFSIVTFKGDIENKYGYIEVKVIVDKNESKKNIEKKIKDQAEKTIFKKDEYTNKPILDNLVKKNDLETVKIKKEKEFENKVIYTTKIPIKNNPFLERAKQYIPIIDNIKNKYGIPRSFILSIIQKESSFLPNVRSKSGALGLMQLIPRYAATEAYIYLYNKKPNPRSLVNELYNPEKNILYGATYIYLLHNKYFEFEKDYSKRKYLVIAGYNMGPIAISKMVRGLNLENFDLSSLYHYLINNTRKETSNYLNKVLIYEKEWNKVYP
ncbi:transglycosylase SLT domain-containing protein [Marinitoga sp. 38H-ov]|uniref:transglycosylase SLT domain-containing protein n=1 Tax=Marinitoga sp. 38H-ov TaxID=1755814 RepID=UPI0013EAB74B|nr:transglycosylase SLT domain-containing protein [Marinitoga sp. 38H-ov]KAF2956498.1 hypothetical protein AS160_05575 [Marinitoga sp. 38H-ov]